MTNSLDRDGKGGMRADLNMGGNKVTNVAPGVAGTDVATVSQLASSASATSVPLGAVIDYWGAVPPTGFLFPVGQAISRATYSDLFALIGTAAGAGDGSTTFNLPDYRGRVGAGKDNMGGTAANRVTSAGAGIDGSTLGTSGGEQTHVLTTPEMPSHSHTVTDPGHSHTTLGVPFGAPSGVSGALAAGSDTTGVSTTGITIANTGGGGAHNNVQPTIIVNKIMRVQ